MISEAFACAQIMRLGGLRFFPAQPEAQEELVVALMESSQDENHARFLVTDWIRGNSESPTPVDFYRMKRKQTSSRGVDPHAEWKPDWTN